MKSLRILFVLILACLSIGGTFHGGALMGGSLGVVVSGRPPLLDMYADYDTRVPALNGDAIEAWADARDSLAELTALYGVTTVDATDCSNNATIDVNLQTAMTNAPSDEVLYLSSVGSGTGECYYNVTSTLTMHNKSNVIIAGRGMGQTFLMLDGVAVAGNGMIGIMLGSDGAFTMRESTSFPWVSGFSMGGTSIGVTDAAGGDDINAGERIWMESTDAEGSTDPWTSVVVSVSGTAPNKTIVIEDPLPIDFASTSATIEVYKAKNNSSGWVEHVGLMDLSIDQTQSARVENANSLCESAPNANCPWWGYEPVEFRSVRHARLERVRFLRAFNRFFSLHGNPTNGNADHAIIRSSRFDELHLAYNRGNNNATMALGAPHSPGHHIVNNVLGARVPRLITYEGAGEPPTSPAISALGYAVAWNYQPPADVISGADTVCVTGAGRSIFFGHSQGPSSFKGTVTEANDFECHMETEVGNAAGSGERNIIYRNRLVRTQNGSRAGILTGGSSYSSHLTFVLNRVRTLSSSSSGTFAHQGADVWMAYNAAESVCNLAANGASGGCAGSGVNYLDDTYIGNVLSTSAVTITQTTDYPVSLILSSAPSWWCQEACAWSDTAGPGAMEANSGGALCKLPAQIRYEGGTCTPP